MAGKWVVARCPDSDPERLEWVEVSAAGAIDGAVARGAPEALAAAAQGRRLAVLVPGERVWVTRVRLAARTRRQREAALPYALEERLADDVESLHCAPGRPGADGSLPAAVVGRELMEAWLSRFAAAGLRVERLLPDCLALPLEPGAWSLWSEGGRTLVRTGPESGYVVDTPNLVHMLRTELHQETAAAPERIVLGGTAVPALAAELEALGIPVERFGPGELLPLLAPGASAPKAPLDLLQGPFGRQERIGRRLRPWRLPAALAALWLVLLVAGKATALHQLRAERAALQAQIDALYLETFSDATRVVDARTQMSQRLERLRGARPEGGFLGLLQLTADALGDRSGYRLQRVAFDDGRMDLLLELPALQAVDTLRQRLAAAGLRAEVVSASAQGERVQARLRIGRGA
ncbi:type II secretion system protein GspL [Thioalbus denitrificans]|uniref:Type II secretion system protein L n=1 Tax=Thioalbus denitrificans TaxID=547122 RepID=A0A369CCD9_9GAMM|nr:type II secretion system protein GspL [Thioalbus denitrificans]RCX31670.1 general secretion pathway protein L [Thioalbus denitrificans]